MRKRASKELPAQRTSGVLLHISSLPGPYGIGDLGPAARQWVTTLKNAGQTWWQTLPLGPALSGFSPYKASSAFAGYPALISPDLLREDGLLAKEDLRRPQFDAACVEYERVVPLKQQWLHLAWHHWRAGKAKRLSLEFERFCHEQASWLEDYATYEALHQMYGQECWTHWPRDLRQRKASAAREMRRELAPLIEQQRFTQFLFFRQLDALRAYAKASGVRLLGDLPIFVDLDSADVWANQHLFQLDRNGRPKAVAGVPPDVFSATGQLWGNPLYDWQAMEREGYRWWIARLKMMCRQFDAVRIDHFRGLAAYWSVPAGAADARGGRWVKAPGAELLEKVRQKLGELPLVAEDLGLITPDVDALRLQAGLPGMAVLQFAYDGDPRNRYLPHNHTRDLIVYPGTHDNDTSAGWFGGLPRREQKRIEQYLPTIRRDPAWTLVEQAWASVGCCAVAQLQDILGLGSDARMNSPSQPHGNWRWRYVPRASDRRRLAALRELTCRYARDG